MNPRPLDPTPDPRRHRGRTVPASASLGRCLVVVVVVLLLLAGAGCGFGDPVASSDSGLTDRPAGHTAPDTSSPTSLPSVPPTDEPPTTAPPTTAPPAGEPTTELTGAGTSPWMPTDSWRADLAVLRVEEPAPRDEYDRGLFGSWIDADGDRCNTRCEVLERQRRSDLPGLPGGGWHSLYDGVVTADASEFDIDHVVALSEAWVSGAHAWDPQLRSAFANDLEPGALLAVSASSNRSKGDRDPAEWQPRDERVWCSYAAAWLRTKVRWDLSADPLEFTMLATMLDTCPN